MLQAVSADTQSRPGVFFLAAPASFPAFFVAEVAAFSAFVFALASSLASASFKSSKKSDPSVRAVLFVLEGCEDGGVGFSLEAELRPCAMSVSSGVVAK